MQGIQDMLLIRKELFEKYSPEPEGMNNIMESANSGTIDNPKGNVPLKVKRYIYEALFAQEYVRKNVLKEVHLVVGGAHELPLEYLLSHEEVLSNYEL